jgi:predicted thioesterase
VVACRRSSRPLSVARWSAPGAAVLLALFGALTLSAPSASATAPTSLASAATAAAALATSQGYRTGIGVLDLQTGQYTGAAEDTQWFASESVVKVMIAARLLATGQMTGSTETTAYQMITQSNDDDANALYGLAGGADVLPWAESYFHLTDLGAPPGNPAWWGSTEITAKGMVYLYAAIGKDPGIGPWMMNAMAHTTKYGADGTNQFFGIPSATTGAAVKQGWGDDGLDTPNAVFNSTGYVDHDRYAVAILTDGAPPTYGSAISAVVTAEAQRLMPNGTIDDPAAHNPTVSAVRAQAIGSTVHVTGTAVDPDAATGSIRIEIYQGDIEVASGSTQASDHRFDVSFNAPDGRQTYTARAVDVGGGTHDTSQTAAAIVVNGDPSGKVSSVVGGTDQITVRGVVTDPNLTAGQPASVRVSIDGRTAATEQATSGSPAGTEDSYDLVVPATPGHHSVTVTFVHTGGGQDVTAGSWPVTVIKGAARGTNHSTTIMLSTTALALPLPTGLLLLRRRRGHRSRHSVSTS